MYLRYSGSFLSHKQVVWRADIYQEAENEFSSVGELSFSAEEPLVIEWAHADKEEVLCSSTAALQIVSPGDRTYEDLYSIKPGNIRLDVYRNGNLYWSGTLDPEFYEEPYSYEKEYEVKLTFSDFGILDRLPYALSGLQTIETILHVALAKSKISYQTLVENHLSTKFTDGEDVTPASISIRSENFFDEDGVASTYKEVVEGLLQPLGMKMIQKNGHIHVFDLNGLYADSSSDKQIVWDGTDAVMGTDKVCNNVKINFSPYADSTLIDSELKYGGDYSTDDVNLTSSVPSVGPECYSYYPDYSSKHKVEGTDWDYKLVDFTIFIDKQGEGLSSIGENNSYFHILPMLGGSEGSGVVVGFYTGGHGSLSSGFPKLKGLSPASKDYKETVAMTTNKVYIPKLSDTDVGRYMLRVLVEALIDPRYNPYESGEDGNEKDNYDDFSKHANYCFIPCDINLYDASGAVIWHYVNKEITQKGVVGSMWASKGRWVSGSALWGDSWLAYYDPDDLKKGTGLLGWKGNRQCIGKPYSGSVYYDAEHSIKAGELWIYDSFKRMDDGQYIPYPPEGGWLEVKVYNAMYLYQYVDLEGPPATSSYWDDFLFKKMIRWFLLKAPKVECVRSNLVFDASESGDVEYAGVVNANAKEEISIDTICGTMTVTCPTAKGVYLRTSGGQQLQQLVRAGRTEHPEQLLIGTLYSQYASRKTTLSGTVVMQPGFSLFTDRAQPDKRFFVLDCSENIIEDTASATFCELRADEYEGVENNG